MDKSKLRYVLCPGSNPSEEFKSLYQSMYDCWYQVWSETYKEMKYQRDLFSDAFTRQDYIGAIFYENKCLGLCLFRWVNTNLDNFSSDSCFSYWNPNDLKPISLHGANVIVASFFAIHPLARKGNLKFSLKELLIAISIEFFMNARASAMAANLRVDKKMNESCAKWGAELIRSNVHVSGGICGDLMVFFKEAVQKSQKTDLEEDVKRLWDQRLIIPKQIVYEADYFLKPKLKAV